MKSPSILPLLGLINPRGRRPSFLVPIFGTAGEEWLQNVGSDGRISAFVRCDHPSEDLLSAPGRTVSLGDSPIYAFECENGSILVDDKARLAGSLRTELQHLALHPFVRLEVCDFLGDSAARLIAERDAVAALAEMAPEVARAWKHFNVRQSPERPISVGSRVIYRNHSEYGFGAVKLMDENALGEMRCLVAFEYIVGTLPCPPSELEVVGEPHEDLQTGYLGDAATFARKLAAALVVQENNWAGNFFRTAVEPLPHQAFLLEKIWGQNRFGHLMADDVGLGKTIEAGLIITNLLQQQRNAKVLVICPAGVALQWQDEMEEHFGHYFSVLGRDSDFSGKTPQGWLGRNLVISSIDRIKREEYKTLLGQVGPFELVICDEAHRLTATRDFLSDHLRTTGNFRLIKELVDSHIIDFVCAPDGTARSPRLLFLSATPHQGDDLRFAFLLSLIRPDLVPSPEKFAESEIPFEILQECISRTPKSHAVDWNKMPLFRGHRTTTAEIHWSESEKRVSLELTNYIERGFNQSGGGPSPLVMVLVMHTFHKLAASSWAALRAALSSRLANLEGGTVEGKPAESETGDQEEFEATQATARPALFNNEVAILRRLIEQIDTISVDSKWAGCESLLKTLDTHWPGKKILVFTQYRATQTILSKRLTGLFPESKIVQLNGDMTLEQRKEARLQFEGSARFLISTEAGGEGINLQRACHLMINYDVTWNPMRMQQRIGRLDRYGQKEVVEVFNLRVPESWDHRVFTRIEERLKTIQATMGPITNQVEDYHEMILGTISESLDEGKLFAEYQKSGHLDDAQIDSIIQRAITSAEKWRSLLRGDLGFSPEMQMRKPTLTPRDFEQTYALLLDGQGVRMQRTQMPDKKLVAGVFHFSPPPQFREPALRATKERYVVFDRDIYAEVRGQVLTRARGQTVTPSLAGFGDPFTDWLFEKGFEAREKESAFSISLSDTDWKQGSGAVLVAALRWLGASRRTKAPDSIVSCFLPAGSTEWRKLDENEMICLALRSKEESALPVQVDPSSAKKLVQAELRTLVEAHNPQGRASADWWWLLAAKVTVS